MNHAKPNTRNSSCHLFILQTPAKHNTINVRIPLRGINKTRSTSSGQSPSQLSDLWGKMDSSCFGGWLFPYKGRRVSASLQLAVLRNESSISVIKQTDSAERKTSVVSQLNEREAAQCVSVCYTDMHYQADISPVMT